MTQPNGTNLPTVCVLCSHNCGLRVDVVDGRIVEVRADETNPITKGYICNKAFEIDHYVEHGDRVRHPMRRRPDGTFEEVDWDTAIAEIAAKLVDVRTRHSPRAIALVGIGGQGNHMDAPTAFLRGWVAALDSAFARERRSTTCSTVDVRASPATFLHADRRREVPPRPRHQSESRTAATPPPRRSRSSPPTRRVQSSWPTRARPRRRAPRRSTSASGPAPTRTSCSAWRPSS
jgi:hypothetical protein